MPCILLLALLFGCSLDTAFTFTDPRDNKTYRAVKIGEQVWMAENLNYEAEGSVCYDYKSKNCKKYGRLYNWDVAMKACPSGWHLPSNEEWDVLYKFVDGSYIAENSYSETAGKDLKAKSGWNKSGNGMDTYGFAALPGGNGYSVGFSTFVNVGYDGYWWGATESGVITAYYRYMGYSNEYTGWDINYKGVSWFSVRCVRD